MKAYIFGLAAMLNLQIKWQLQ